MPSGNNDMLSFTHLVELAWEEQKSHRPEMAERMKRAFVLEMTHEIYRLLNKEHESGRLAFPPDVDEIAGFVFHFHYFYTGRLPDGERSKYQRSTEYKGEFIKKVTNQILLRMQSISLKNLGTVYDPEIACCEAYVDALARVALSIKSPTVADDKLTVEKFETVRSLILSMIALVKSILYQMTSASPSHALISWRSLLELEYKVLVLCMYDGVLTRRFLEFGKYEALDEDSDPASLAKFRERAEIDGFDIRHQGYKNYGWLLSIEAEEDTKPYPSLKYLMTVVGEPDRYEQFRIASIFTHSSANMLKRQESEIYGFLVVELARSLSNLKEATDMLKEQYCVTTEEHDVAVEACFKYYMDALAQFNINHVMDTGKK